MFPPTRRFLCLLCGFVAAAWLSFPLSATAQTRLSTPSGAGGGGYSLNEAVREATAASDDLWGLPMSGNQNLSDDLRALARLQSTQQRPEHLVDLDQDFTGTASDITRYLQRALNVIMVITGAIAVFLLILSGNGMILSMAGDELAKKKKAVQWILIGLLLIIFAYVIVKTVLTVLYSAEDCSDDINHKAIEDYQESVTQHLASLNRRKLQQEQTFAVLLQGEADDLEASQQQILLQTLQSAANIDSSFITSGSTDTNSIIENIPGGLGTVKAELQEQIKNTVTQIALVTTLQTQLSPLTRKVEQICATANHTDHLAALARDVTAIGPPALWPTKSNTERSDLIATIQDITQ